MTDKRVLSSFGVAVFLATLWGFWFQAEQIRAQEAYKSQFVVTDEKAETMLGERLFVRINPDKAGELKFPAFDKKAMSEAFYRGALRAQLDQKIADRNMLERGADGVRGALGQRTKYEAVEDRVDRFMRIMEDEDVDVFLNPFDFTPTADAKEAFENLYEIRLTERNKAAVREMVNTLLEEEIVTYAEPDVEYHTTLITNDDYGDPSNGSNYQYELGLHNAHEAWDISTTGQQQIRVAVMDSGFAIQSGSGQPRGHEDLMNVCHNNGQLIGNGNPYASGKQHGTMVASEVAAPTNDGSGMATFSYNNLCFIPMKGLGLATHYNWIINQNQAGNRIHLLNGSFGCAKDSGGTIRGSGNPCYRASEASLMNQLRSSGTLFIAAAGNHQNGWVHCPSCTGDEYGYPCAHDSVMCVASLKQDGLQSGHTAYNDAVDIATAGTQVFVADGTSNTAQTRASGTSMATPLTTSIAALIASHNPSLTPNQMEQILKDGAVDLDGRLSSRFRGGLGAGKSDACNSLAITLGQDPQTSGCPERPNNGSPGPGSGGGGTTSGSTNTTTGTTTGAPADDDNDGVPDASDQCPNTAANATVDANGCTDDDGDTFFPDADSRAPQFDPNDNDRCVPSIADSSCGTTTGTTNDTTATTTTTGTGATTDGTTSTTTTGATTTGSTTNTPGTPYRATFTAQGSLFLSGITVNNTAHLTDQTYQIAREDFETFKQDLASAGFANDAVEYALNDQAQTYELTIKTNENVYNSLVDVSGNVPFTPGKTTTTTTDGTTTTTDGTSTTIAPSPTTNGKNTTNDGLPITNTTTTDGTTGPSTDGTSDTGTSSSDTGGGGGGTLLGGIKATPADGASVAVGDVVYYDIELRNLAQASVNNVVITGAVHPAFTFDSTTDNEVEYIEKTTAAGQEKLVQVTIPTLGAEAKKTISYGLRLEEATPGARVCHEVSDPESDDGRGVILFGRVCHTIGEGGTTSTGTTTDGTTDAGTGGSGELQITATATPNIVGFDDEVTLTLLIQNDSNAPVRGVSISENINENLIFVRSQPPAETDPALPQRVWNLPGSIEPGANREIVQTFKIAPSAVLEPRDANGNILLEQIIGVNAESFSTPRAVTAQVIVGAPDASFTMELTTLKRLETLRQGEPFEALLTLTNGTDFDLENLSFTFETDNSLAFQAANSSTAFTAFGPLILGVIGDMAHEQKTLPVSFVAEDPSGALCLRMKSVTGDAKKDGVDSRFVPPVPPSVCLKYGEKPGPIAPDPGPGTDTEAPEPGAPGGGFTVKMSATPGDGTSVAVGETVTYTWTIENGTRFTMEDVLINDVLPGVMAFVEGDNPIVAEQVDQFEDEQNAFLVQALIPRLSPGETKTLTYKAKPTRPSGEFEICNKVEQMYAFPSGLETLVLGVPEGRICYQITGDALPDSGTTTGDETTDTDSEPAPIEALNVFTSTNDAGGGKAVDDTVSFDVTVENTAEAAAEPVVVTILPQGLVYVASSGDGTVTPEDNKLVVNFGLVPGRKGGQPSVERVTVSAKIATAGKHCISAANIETEGNYVGDDMCFSTEELVPEAQVLAQGLSLSVTANPPGDRTPVPQGTPITYEITLKNESPMRYQNVRIVGQLDSFVTYKSATTSGVKYDEERHQIVIEDTIVLGNEATTWGFTVGTQAIPMGVIVLFDAQATVQNQGQTRAAQSQEMRHRIVIADDKGPVSPTPPPEKVTPEAPDEAPEEGLKKLPPFTGKPGFDPEQPLCRDKDEHQMCVGCLAQPGAIETSKYVYDEAPAVDAWVKEIIAAPNAGADFQVQITLNATPNTGYTIAGGTIMAVDVTPPKPEGNLKERTVTDRNTHWQRDKAKTTRLYSDLSEAKDVRTNTPVLELLNAGEPATVALNYRMKGGLVASEDIVEQLTNVVLAVAHLRLTDENEAEHHVVLMPKSRPNVEQKAKRCVGNIEDLLTEDIVNRSFAYVPDKAMTRVTLTRAIITGERGAGIGVESLGEQIAATQIPEAYLHQDTKIAIAGAQEAVTQAASFDGIQAEIEALMEELKALEKRAVPTTELIGMTKELPTKVPGTNIYFTPRGEDLVLDKRRYTFSDAIAIVVPEGDVVIPEDLEYTRFPATIVLLDPNAKVRIGTGVSYLEGAYVLNGGAVVSGAQAGEYAVSNKPLTVYGSILNGDPAALFAYRAYRGEAPLKTGIKPAVEFAFDNRLLQSPVLQDLVSQNIRQ